MSSNCTLRTADQPCEVWIGLDMGDPRGDMSGYAIDGTPVRLFVDTAGIEVDEDALAAEAKHTGIIITISLPAGVLITWLIDWLTGGPGIATMIGL